ncbi:MAG: hypothetical protein LBJ00_01800 [Planctomycetaceae bacterium]|nr:hypothetical protein [Planctomycetaceae bacterium]
MQQRETVVRGRSLPPYRLRYTGLVWKFFTMKVFKTLLSVYPFTTVRRNVY